MDYSGRIITKNPVTPTQTSASGVWSLQEAESSVKNNTWPVPGVYNPISRSLRFNSADSAYLNRTPSVAGNRKTWTWSGWVKRSALGVAGAIFAAGGANGQNFVFYFESDDTVTIFNLTSFADDIRLRTSQVFRDVSSWYHVVFAVDTTQATASNRAKFYVNGTQVTAFSTATYPALNFDTRVNSTEVHTIGARSFDAPALAFNGYLTEINFIDGQQLTPSSFGTTDPQTGVWVPVAYTGTYGTNGFYLNFKDNTNTTTLGYDYSGNNNNWTTNNFSITAGSGNDSLIDVPTPWTAYNTTGDIGGVVRGNYCTLNPIFKQDGNTNTTYGSMGTPSNGNLEAVLTTGQNVYGTIGLTSVANRGSWYAEAVATSITSDLWIGVMASDGNTNRSSYISKTSGVVNEGTNKGTAGFAANDVIGIAYNTNTGAIQFYKNGATIGASYNMSTAIYEQYFWCYSNSGATVIWNFGQRPFAYTPPSGYKSLCTTNLPTPTIGATSTTQAGKYFNPVLWTGNGSTQSITGVGFQPDFVWAKSRSSGVTNHALFDAVRGADLWLGSNVTNAEVNGSGTFLTAFNSDGFSVGSGAIVNTNTGTYVAWNWNAGGSNATNTSGTITSTVRANTTAGFSVVTYTGNGNSSQTCGHGLGVTPSMVIWKNRDDVDAWIVYHNALTTNEYLVLNTTGAKATVSGLFTGISSTLLPLNNVSAAINANAKKYVAYCFAAVAGYSAFGSYTGNGSTDGPFIFTGFRPRYVLIKRTDSTGEWFVQDTSVNTYNLVTNYLYPNASSAEQTNGALDILSNGFKLRNSYVPQNNNAGAYIYAAFAESPFKYSLAR